MISEHFYQQFTKIIVPLFEKWFENDSENSELSSNPSTLVQNRFLADRSVIFRFSIYFQNTCF